MSIGSKIKALRRAKNLTQEDLAEYLNISSKAVSQWECDRTAPDISQLPAICNIFKITADELLGIDILKQISERDQMLDEEYQLAKNGFHMEAWELLQAAIKKFPNDFHVMRAILAESVFVINLDEYLGDKDKIKEDCKHYCDLIMESCTDDQIRHSAITHLCSYYSEIGDFDKAVEMANKMPILCQSQDFLYADIGKGTKRAKSNKNLIFMLIQFLLNRITGNYVLDSGEHLYSADEISALRDKAIALMELMFENGDYGFFHAHLCDLHSDQARLCYAPKKNKEMTVHHLEKAAEHAIKLSEFMKSERYLHSSLLFKLREDSPRGVMFSDKDNAAMKTLKHLDCHEYDFMKDSVELIKLREQLAPFAGQNEY